MESTDYEASNFWFHSFNPIWNNRHQRTSPLRIFFNKIKRNVLDEDELKVLSIDWKLEAWNIWTIFIGTQRLICPLSGRWLPKIFYHDRGSWLSIWLFLHRLCQSLAHKLYENIVRYKLDQVIHFTHFVSAEFFSHFLFLLFQQRPKNKHDF